MNNALDATSQPAEDPRACAVLPDGWLQERVRLVDLTEAGHLLGNITTRYVRTLFGAGELETVKIGRRRLVVVESLDAYVDRLRHSQRG